MNKLTESEQIAYEWLENEVSKNIEKTSGGGEPDFIVDGEKIEVKRKESSGIIYLTPLQKENFPKTNPKVIIIENKEIKKIISFNQIDKDMIKTQEKSESRVVSVNLSISFYEELKDYVKESSYLSQSEYIRTLLRKDLEETGTKL